MDVDIHPIRRDPDEQVHFRAAFLDRGDAVGLGNRVRNGSVLHDPPVDENVLGAADGALVTEGGHVAMDLDPGRLFPDLDQIEPFTKELKEPITKTARRWTLENFSTGARQREPDLGISKRHLRDKP